MGEHRTPGADREARVSSIYHAALELGVAERAELLRDSCGEDDALRHEVESLLADQSKAAGLLSKPALGLAAQMMSANPSSSFVGQQLGGYHILSLLGAGGMGEKLCSG